MRDHVTSALLIASPVAWLLYVGAVGARVLAARPERVWLLALLPLASMVAGPRTRTTIVVAVLELAALLPLHALITLVRAARLEGG